MTQIVPDYILPAKRLARFTGYDEKETILLARDIRSPSVTAEGVRAVVMALRTSVLNRAIETLPPDHTRKMVWAAIRKKAAFDRKAWAGVIPDNILAEAYDPLDVAGLRKKRA